MGWDNRLVDALTVARAVTRRPGTLPSFLVVGARRAGSTTAYEWIVQHPAIEPCRAKKGTHYFDVHHHRGFRWFRSCFPVVDGSRITGEASAYYMFHPLAPRRIAAELPHARLIVVLRDPAGRAWSHYQYSRRMGFDDLSFPEAVRREEQRLAGEEQRLIADPSYAAHSFRHHSYLARGRYAEQIERLYALFPVEQILVLQSEALFADPATHLTTTWQFLGLPPYQSPTDLRRYKQARYEPLPDQMRAWLDDYFRPHNERLYALPGINFRWDSTHPAHGAAPNG